MIEGILIGLSTALSLTNILMVMVGCFAGTIIGMLPGLGPMTAIALMIPITYGFDPSTGLILMAGVYYGAVFGGSTSSILLNAPGIPGTVATAFDGYPMAQQGKAGKALAIAAYSSFAGGTISAIFLLVAAPSLSKVSLAFRSPDYFALMILGLTAISAFSSKGQFLKAMMMGFEFIPTFLSFAPGGIHEMVVISVAYNIDPIFVSYHHFLRIFIIVLFLPFLLSKFRKTN